MVMPNITTACKINDASTAYWNRDMSSIASSLRCKAENLSANGRLSSWTKPLPNGNDLVEPLEPMPIHCKQQFDQCI
jgi:hypothetical protein